MPTGKDQMVALGRPQRRAAIVVHDALRRPSLHGHDVDLSILTCESDLAAVVGKVRIADLKRRERQLFALGTIDAAAPQRVVGVRRVLHPLAVGRKCRANRRNSVEEWLKLMCFRIETDHFAARLVAYGEDLLAIAAGHRTLEEECAGCQPDWLGRTVQPAGLHGKGPKVG